MATTPVSLCAEMGGRSDDAVPWMTDQGLETHPVQTIPPRMRAPRLVLRSPCEMSTMAARGYVGAGQPGHARYEKAREQDDAGQD